MLAAEVEGILGRAPEVVAGGVLVRGPPETALRLALWSRVAGQVLVRLGVVRATSLQELQAHAASLPWKEFATWGQPMEVRCTLDGAPIRRPDAAAHKIELAARDALRGPSLASRRPKSPARFLGRWEGPRVTVSAEVSVDSLHRRGYRQQTAKAPLRENLGAACLLAAGWSPAEPLVDPLCGSGTFAIEAAWMATRRAPGLDVEVLAAHWPCLPSGTWERLRSEAAAARVTTSAVIVAGDRDPGAVAATRGNAERAGVAGLIRLRHADVAEPWPLPPGSSGLVIVNPPYGQRVGPAALPALHGAYRHISQALEARFAGWRLAVVCPDKALARRLGDVHPLVTFPHGGSPVTLWVGSVRAPVAPTAE